MLLLVSIIFLVGYVAIILEHPIRINKAASALVTGVACWAIYALLSSDKRSVAGELAHHMGDVSGILFFLLGAMVIVELIDAHDGFEIITERITTTNKKKLVWITGFISFFLSAVLDNLTTTIVMISLLRKIVPDQKDRLMLAALVVIAANSGGAWSPIGDVTTTMLWIGGQVTVLNIIAKIIFPGLVSFLVPAFLVSRQMKGEITRSTTNNGNILAPKYERNTVFAVGICVLLLVPVFKTLTGLPPFMGLLFGLGIMWIITEIIHSEKDEGERGVLSVNHALRKIDTPSILFFLGILISIAALQVTGVLSDLALWMDKAIGNMNIITILIGFLSSVVDNVPLVAAAQGMYPLDQFHTDHYFWTFLAYCAGTGGSLLVIGSAAGVVAMGMEKINFFWYLKKISWLALIGYLAGAGVFILQEYF